MTDRAAMTEPREAPEQALERSLRAGPADDGRYRVGALDLSTDAHIEARLRVRASRSSRAIPLFASLDSIALLVGVVFVGFLILRGTIPSGPGRSLQSTQEATASPIPVPPLTETFVSTRNGF